MTENESQNNFSSLESEKTMLEIATKKFEMWNETLLTKNPKLVADLYTEDATFLPTLSDKFKIGQSGAEEYFVHFLEKNPEGKIVDGKVQTIDSNSFIHSGIYNFEVDDDKGGRQVVEARFTFGWKKNNDGDWKIFHHHSSLRPMAK